MQRYLAARHPAGGMNGMDAFDYADMVEQTPVTTWVIEYREPSVDGVPGALVGACLTDQQSDGLSMIYSFYDPELASRKGLGTRSEEQTSELQSLMRNSYAVLFLKKKKTPPHETNHTLNKIPTNTH